MNTITIITLISIIAVSGYAAYLHYRHLRYHELSKWARVNRLKARWMLVAFNLAMSVCGAALGLLCMRIGLQMSEGVLYTGLVLFALGTLFYPNMNRSEKGIATRYRRRQIMTGLRVSGATIACIAFANLYTTDMNGVTVQEAAVHPAILIVLCTLGLIAFGFLILVLSCSLACQGYDGLALTVFVFGIGGLIFLYVWLLIRIQRKHQQRKNNSQLLDNNTLDNV